MKKIGQFIYSWGNGHYSRMMSLNDELSNYIKGEYEVHYSSKEEIYQKLLTRFPDKKSNIHEILMPTPIDGKYGPSICLSMLNLLLPISGKPPLVKQVSSCLRKEAKLFDTIGFDLVINDGDMGPNVLAKNRKIKSIFVTNQFMPKFWKSHFYFYPGAVFIAKQIAKATKIIVADSPPPYTICEYNLNFPDKIKEKVVYAGHFATSKKRNPKEKTDFERLIEGADFGYWMRTGNKSTNMITGKKYEEVFHADEIKNEKRIISQAVNDPLIDKVLGKDGKAYSFADALEKKIDWIQIDVGFLSEEEKETTLDHCKYAVINGSHTVMGEIIGIKGKPIIGMPVYDEQTNQIQWAQEHGLGIGAKSRKQVIRAILEIRENHGVFEESIRQFKENFVPNGAQTAARIASQMLEDKR
ncbi:MAG TPA: glycosyltransferase [Candidatus Nitrosotenuis sp.]|nr:glycosyltransferase [Candidatus Nitrosotenuis sp.]